MYPGSHLATSRDKPAVIAADTGIALSYGDLEERSIRASRIFHDAGLRRGDVIALIAENTLTYFEVYWGAIRSGLYITAVNQNLGASEITYIVADSGAKVVVMSARLRDLALAVAQEIPSDIHVRRDSERTHQLLRGAEIRFRWPGRGLRILRGRDRSRPG